jgi:hypothetical protein
MPSVVKGTRLYLATQFGSVVPTTAVSKASEAVVTANAHGFVAGDIVEFSSGWGRADKRAFRVKDPSTNAFTLEGLNTTNDDFFPAGQGVGSVRKVSTWVQVTKVLDNTPSGGTPKNITYSYWEEDGDGNVNDGFEANSSTLTLGTDARGTPGFAALQTLTDTQTPTILRIVERNAAIELMPCTVAMNSATQRQGGQINRFQVAVNGTARSTLY